MAARGSVRVRCSVCRKAKIKDGYMLKDKRVCKHKERNFLALFKRESQTCETQDEAINWLAKTKLRNHKNPDITAKSQVRFEALANDWLEEKKKIADFGIDTFSNYESTIKTHLIPAFGRYYVTDITPKMVRDLRLSLQNESISLQQKVSMRLNAILRKAAFESLISDLPTENMEPLSSPGAIDYNILETSQIRDFLNSITDDFLRLYYKLPIYTGLRAGEVAGLMWDCVNFEERWIEVRRVIKWLTKKQMARSGNATPWKIKLCPKTPSGFRRIPIDSELAKELQIFKIEQPENRFDLVFAKKKVVYDKAHAFGYGKEPMPINPAVLNPNNFKPDATAAGIPNIKYHELRHTFCSLAYAAGVEEYVTQYYMGHKDAALTRGIYRHLSEEKKRQGAGFAQKIADLITPNRVNVLSKVESK